MQRIAITSAGVASVGLLSVCLYPHKVAGEIKCGLGTEAYKRLAWPILCRMDPETAHLWTIKAAQAGLTPIDRVADSPALATRVLGLWLRNPVGLAAGCDHNAEAVRGFEKMGFGFVEVGSVTPKPQQGSPKPRIFRLEEDRGVINRVGFSNEGADAVANRLAALRADGYSGVIGVNLAFNKESAADPAPDFEAGVEKLGPLADYLVINAAMLYHPPAPAFRTAKHPKELGKVIKAVVIKRSKICPTVPILVKIHPDFPDSTLREVVTAIQTAGADGIILAGPSAQRPASLASPNMHEVGGLSGEPVKDLSTEAIKKVYSMTRGNIPLIGVGGIASGEDAYKRIRAGASLVQVYTGLAYEGPYAVPTIKWDMEERAEIDGFENLQQAVGADVNGLFPAGHPNEGLRRTFSTWFSRPDSII